MPGENSNPYQYTKTVDQIIVERNNARKKAREIAAANKDKAQKTRKLNNLTQQDKVKTCVAAPDPNYLPAPDLN